MKRIILIISCFFSILFPSAVFAARVKDVATIRGVRENEIIGYGLVVGLKGSGDSYSQIKATVQTLANMLINMGINVSQNDLRSRNAASVMVTATLPAYAKQGSRIDVTVASIGDSRSLLGGILLMTPLRAADKNVYAIAQGAISVGNYDPKKNSSSAQGIMTVAAIPNGAIIERELQNSTLTKSDVFIITNSSDFTTASNIADAINNSENKKIAIAIDPQTVKVSVGDYKDTIVQFIAKIENIDINVGERAVVIVDERTGSVVIGKDVRISAVAISHGDLAINIAPQGNAGQPQGSVTQSSRSAKDKANRVVLLQQGVAIGDVVRALNTIGVSPKDLVIILQLLKKAGALQAELKVM